MSSDLAADNIFSMEGGVCGTAQHKGCLTAQLSSLNNMAQCQQLCSDHCQTTSQNHPGKYFLNLLFIPDSLLPSQAIEILLGERAVFRILHPSQYGEYQGCSAVFQGCQFCLEPSTEPPLSVGYELRPIVLLTFRPSSHAQLFTGVGNSLKHAYFQTAIAA